MADIPGSRRAMGHLRQATEHLADLRQQTVQADGLAAPHVHRASRYVGGFQRRHQDAHPIGHIDEIAVPLAVAGSVAEAADLLRPHLALYAGGMGSATTNFHREAMARAGFEDALEEVAAHYAAGDRARAAAAIPEELVREVCLVGTPSDIAAQLPRWEASCVTTLVLQTDPRALPALAPLVAGSGATA